MKKQRREEKGITLVALVVTIIVLIILAGVTLNIVLDQDGIINKARQAADDYENSQKAEQNLLGQVDDYIEYMGRTATIPEGYTASQIDTEDTIAEGLVIYEIPEGATVDWNSQTVTINGNITNLQETVNQYVWIPVNDINDMVMCSSNTGESVCNLVLEGNTLKCTVHENTATDLVGRLYTINNVTDEGPGIYSYEMDFTKRDQRYSSGYHEPGIVTGNGTEYDGDSSNLEIAGMEAGSTAEQFLEQLKRDFTEMATSVAKNGGFYVSRYEIGANGESQKNQTVLTSSNSSGNMWYGLYDVCRDIESRKQMLWDCQYDQIIKFIGKQAQIGHTDRNITIVKTTSGQNEFDKMKNIYDLEGNYREWVPAGGSSERVYRGSRYYDTKRGYYYPASVRFSNYPNIVLGSISARSTLYL